MLSTHYAQASIPVMRLQIIHYKYKLIILEENKRKKKGFIHCSLHDHAPSLLKQNLTRKSDRRYIHYNEIMLNHSFILTVQYVYRYGRSLLSVICIRFIRIWAHLCTNQGAAYLIVQDTTKTFFYCQDVLRKGYVI